MRSFIAKVISITGLLFVLFIASSIVAGLVRERQQYRATAQESIGNSYPGDQIFTGPIFVINYEEHYIEEKLETIGKVTKKIRVPSVKTAEYYVLPEQLTIAQQQQIKERKRGIFKLPTYQSQLDVSGSVKLPTAEQLQRTEKDSVIKVLPRVSMLVIVSDARGLSQVQANLKTTSLELNPSIERTALGPVAKLVGDFARYSDIAGERQSFSLKLGLAGTSSIFFSPIGRNTQISLQTDWPHPSFTGAVLPTSSKKSDAGYSAQWLIDSVSTESPSLVLAALTSDKKIQTDRSPSAFQSVGMQLIDPVDIYVLNDRSTKYAMLFVVLILGSFVVFELFKQLKIHPVQYLMVGLAIVMFFLLLLSLSEQIGFAKAYLVAASACTLLIAVYASFILGSWRRAIPLGLGITGLYLALYKILNSEQDALLMATLLLFSLLSVVMLATRKTNWFALLKSVPTTQKTTTA
jgi:inner membrane protein